MYGNQFAAARDFRTLSKMVASLRFGACFLLLVCLTNMVTAEGQALRLLNMQRIESADKTTFTFTAQFKANKKPTAECQDPADEYQGTHEPLANSTLEYDEISKEGTASITGTKKGQKARILYLEIGDKGSQYFTVYWKTSGEGSLSTDVNWCAARVTPGTDVTYSAGNPTKVFFEVKQNGSFDIKEPSTGRLFMYSTLYHDATANAVQSDYYSDFFKNKMSKQDGMTVNSLTFNPHETTFNGFLRSVIHVHTNAPVTNLFETILLSVHEDQYAGPFPDGVYAQWMGGNEGCFFESYYPCAFTCRAFGNNVDSVQIFKLDDDGTRTPGPGETHQMMSSKYDWSTTFIIDTTQDFAGTYVCQVKGDNGTAETEVLRKIIKFEKAAKVLVFTNMTLDDGTIELACTAEGSGPLEVWLGSYKEDPLQEGRLGVLSYAADEPSVEGSNNSLTAVAVVDTPSYTIYCVASNWGGYDISYKFY